MDVSDVTLLIHPGEHRIMMFCGFIQSSLSGKEGQYVPVYVTLFHEIRIDTFHGIILLWRYQYLWFFFPFLLGILSMLLFPFFPLCPLFRRDMTSATDDLTGFSI